MRPYACLKAFINTLLSSGIVGLSMPVRPAEAVGFLVVNIESHL